ncbi:DUF2236 domain-containing protein [Thermoleophilia bacterium SCSIO 60948]|nr:DUF2236 domain-containing protein [Thermoleophilia bacterium SCSIO 60948]
MAPSAKSATEPARLPAPPIGSRPSRHWARDELARLDPIADHERAAHLVTSVIYGDPPVAGALYTVAFVRQMAIPSIARVVHRGGRGPSIRDTRKRNDDTITIFGEILRHGYSSPAGRAMIGRMVEIHSRFPISNDQNLYTLASLALEATRVPQVLGRRLMSEELLDSTFLFWRGVGLEMGLEGIPETRAEYLRWTDAYEREHFGYTAGGREVADAMLDDYAERWAPRPLRPAARAFVRSLCDDRLLATLRLDPPPRGARRATGLGVEAYKLGRRALPDPPERSYSSHYGTYAPGTPLSEIGFQRD